MDVTRMCQADEAIAWGDAHEALDDCLEDAEALSSVLLYAAGWACPANESPTADSVAVVPYYALAGWSNMARRVVGCLYDLREVADARSSHEGVARHGDV